VTPDPSAEQLHETDAVEAVVADDVLEEAVDGEPVLDAQERSLVPALGAALAPVATPAVQAAAAAATGFVAGAATLAIARRASARRVARTAVRRRADGLPVVGSRSFLIDIHMLRPE
jgi:hypothetical protein